MKVYRGILAAIVILLLGYWAVSNYVAKIDQEDKESPLALVDRLEKDGIPDITAEDLSGKKVRVRDLKTKLIVLNFWATWCSPCVEEFPSLVKMATTFKDDVILVTISSDERKSDVVDFLKVFGGSGLNMVHLLDPGGRWAKAMGTVRLPETYVLSGDYKLLRKVSSTQNWASDDAMSFIKGLIAKQN